MKALLQQTDIGRSAKTLWFFVLDIKYATHFVAILCLETTIVKAHISGHFRVYKTQALLLAASD